MMWQELQRSGLEETSQSPANTTPPATRMAAAAIRRTQPRFRVFAGGPPRPRSAPLRSQDRVEDPALLPDDLSLPAPVQAVVASEAAGVVEVADVVRMGPPVPLHLREGVGFVKALHL